MTTLRPEHSTDGPMSYEDTGQFEAVVGGLADPLNDPLPGRPPAVPLSGTDALRAPGSLHGAGPGPGPGSVEQAPFTQAPGPSSPWFRTSQGPPAHGQEPALAQPAPTAPASFVPQAPAEPMAPGTPRGPEPARTDVTATAQLPVVDQPRFDGPGYDGPSYDPAPDAAVRPEAAQDGEAQLAGADGLPAAPPLPADGGRAARRKAARQGSSSGGGHRARGRNATGPAAAAEAAATPRSRVEARRAAKAAKDSPGVVISRVVGELFITTGVVMLLFVTYQLWWTNIRAHQQANSASNNLEHQWAATSQDPNRAPGTFSPGQGFAIMYIPKLDVKAPIAQGVDKHSVLDKGMIGHYDGSLNTAMPWDKTGNFAVAAHRNTHGEPFRYINHLVPGDKVVVETASDYFTYMVTSSLASTPPTNTSVLKPIPAGSGFTGYGRYLTLTTCTPEFTSTNRLIVWGKLIEDRPRSKGKPDALLQG